MAPIIVECPACGGRVAIPTDEERPIEQGEKVRIASIRPVGYMAVKCSCGWYVEAKIKSGSINVIAREC